MAVSELQTETNIETYFFWLYSIFKFEPVSPQILTPWSNDSPVIIY